MDVSGINSGPLRSQDHSPSHLPRSMAFHVHVDTQWRVGVIRFMGCVAGSEVIRAISTMLDHPDWEPGYCRLTDSAGVSVMDVTPDDLERMVLQEHAEYERMGPGRKAMVVPERLLDIAEVYRQSIQRGPHPYELELFTDEAEAWRWLCGPCVDDAALTRL